MFAWKKYLNIKSTWVFSLSSCPFRQNPWSRQGNLFFLSIFWPGSYSHIWENPRSSVWNLLDSLAHTILKIKVVSSVTAFKLIILYITYISKLQTEHIILCSILDCILGGILYPWLRWIIYATGNTWFLLFFSELFQGLTVGKATYNNTFLSDFRARRLSARCLLFTLSSESRFPGRLLPGLDLDLPGFSLGLA